MKNENYLPEEYLIKDINYMMMKETITCKLCKKLFKDSMICKSCQNTFCKNCLKYWGKFCPNNCENPNYVENKSVIDILSKLNYE